MTSEAPGKDGPGSDHFCKVEKSAKTDLMNMAASYMKHDRQLGVAVHGLNRVDLLNFLVADDVFKKAPVKVEK